jgi:tetratricopeptide (TPR) repeat protein
VEERAVRSTLAGFSPGADAKWKIFYGLSLIFFTLGLLSKPMLVTLPVILVLLDYWPLQWWRRPWSRLWLEKIPFFLLAALVAGMTFVAQRQNRIPLEHVPMAERLANLPMACARYMGKLFYPTQLAVFYPYVHHWPAGKVAGAAAFMALVTGWVVWRARAQPFLVVGWLWFLVGLTPVCGLVQVGTQSMADRYTYVPAIGLFLMVAWLADGTGKKPGRLAAALPMAAALCGCLYLTYRQAGYWKDTATLLARSIETTEDNYFLCTMLGDYLAQNGQKAAGMQYLERAVTIAPAFTRAQNDLGHLLLDAGRPDEALTHLQQAVALKPDAPEGHYNLGLALLAKGRPAEALDQFQTQVNLKPGDAIAQLNFGAVLLENNLAEDAIPHLEKAADLDPANAEAHYKLGNAYFSQGQMPKAVAHYETSLRLRPAFIPACNNLAWILGSSPLTALRNGARAVEIASRADRLAGGKDPVVAGTLAVAWAEAGRFSAAMEAASRARDLAQAQTNSALIRLLDERIRLFQAGLPFRDAPRRSNGDGH